MVLWIRAVAVAVGPHQAAVTEVDVVVVSEVPCSLRVAITTETATTLLVLTVVAAAAGEGEVAVDCQAGRRTYASRSSCRAVAAAEM